MSRTLHVAFIAGLMYEPLYEELRVFTAATGIEVAVAYSGDHPALNAHLESSSSPPYDLVSTHTKYAPSQVRFLAPLQSIFGADDLCDFYPKIIDLATVGQNLLSIPRNIDVRLLHYRTDLIQKPPRTWDELAEVAQSLTRSDQFFGFVFPGCESGLFGTFFELAESAGAHLFSANNIPDIQNEGGHWALTWLANMYRKHIVPSRIVHWHYDAVHNFFREGRAAMAGDWPAFYQAHRDPRHSAIYDRFAVAQYPAGPSGHSKTYGGCHAFALTHRGAANADAVELLRFLTAPERQLSEANRGSVPVRRSVMQQVLAAASPLELERWRTLESVIEHSVLIPPKLHYYPQIEDVLWRTVQSAMTGEVDPDNALASIVSQITAIIESNKC